MRLALPGYRNLALPGAGGREMLAAATRVAALVALSGAIVFSPIRARLLLEERPLPPLFADYRDFHLYWNEIFVLSMLALWGASLLLQPRRIDFGPLLVRVPVATLLVMTFLSVPFAQDRPLALFHAVSLLGFVAMALYVLNEVKSIAQVLPAIGLMVFLQAVVAVTQVVNQGEFGLGWLGEHTLNPELHTVSVLWTDEAPRLLRGYGLSDHPNILGGVLAAAVFLVLAAMTRLREGPLMVACGAFGIGVAAVFMTFSRAAALGLVAGLAVGLAMLLFKRDWRTAGLWVAACLVAVLVTAPLVRPYTPYLIARVNPTAQQAGSTEERALSERQALVRNTNEIFVQYPALGVGAGVLPTVMLEKFPDFEYHHSPAHMVILVVAAETGIVGAFSYGVLMLAPWLLLWLRRDRLTPELIGASGALAAITVVGLLDYYTWSLTPGRLWFWLVMGLWVLAYRRSERRAADA